MSQLDAPERTVHFSLENSGNVRVPLVHSGRSDLQSELDDARRQIQQLRSIEAEHKKAREHLELTAHALRERVKEINCLYSISEIAGIEGLALPEVIQRIVDSIPTAWQYPEVTCSRVTIYDEEHCTRNFSPIGDRQAQSICIAGVPVGIVEVLYLEPKPTCFEGPFLREERSLINAVASRIGEIVAKRRTDAAVAASHAKNRALLAAIPDLIVQVDASGQLLDFHVGDYTVLSGLLSGMVGKLFGSLFGDPDCFGYRNQSDGSATAFGALEEARVFERHLVIDGRTHDFEIRLVQATETTMLGILRDITQRKRLEREILEVSCREQRRIGRDLHDGLCQHLVGIRFLAQALARRVPSDHEHWAKDALEIARLIDDAISVAKGLTRGLLPVRLEADGLESGLNDLAKHAERLFGVHCRIETEVRQVPIDADVALHVYRIAQEALNNAIKHGQASEVVISLKRPTVLATLTVKDNGKGFVVGPDTVSGMGLGIMRYRACMVGGTLEVESQPSNGATITCRFPAIAAE